MMRSKDQRRVVYGKFKCKVDAGTQVGAVIRNPNYSLRASVEGFYQGCPTCGEDTSWAFDAGNECLNCGRQGKPTDVRKEAEPLLVRVQEVYHVEGSNGAFDRSEHEGWVNYYAICTAVAE